MEKYLKKQAETPIEVLEVEEITDLKPKKPFGIKKRGKGIDG